MYIDGITGAASDKNHKDWINITSIKWDIQRDISSASSTRGDRESSNARLNDLELTRYLDKATPGLFLAACCGKGSTIKLVQTKTGAGAGADPFIEYTLRNALVSHYQVEAISDAAARPCETLTLSYTALEIKYTAYNNDGAPQAPLIVGFDSATNTRL